MKGMGRLDRLLTSAGLACGLEPGQPRVRYGDLPWGKGGPLTKLKLLRTHFPEHRHRFNLIYLLSAGRADFDLIEGAKRRGVKVVLNQNGVYYPAVRPGDWREANEPMRRMIALADHVFYQSEYSRRVAEEYLGPVAAPGEILHNAVDVERFAPGGESEELVRLLSTGLITDEVRVELFGNLLRGLWELKSVRDDWRFEFAGSFGEGESALGCQQRVFELVEHYGLNSFVRFHPRFDAEEAPEVFRRGDVYLHCTYNDACPNAVLEAMACGLPVVYFANGGAPELVGEEAGVGVPCETDPERIVLGDAFEYARAIAAVMDRRVELGRAARARAVTRFSLTGWIARHRALFAELLGGGHAPNR